MIRARRPGAGARSSRSQRAGFDRSSRGAFGHVAEVDSPPSCGSADRSCASRRRPRIAPRGGTPGSEGDSPSCTKSSPTASKLDRLGLMRRVSPMRRTIARPAGGDLPAMPIAVVFEDCRFVLHVGIARRVSPARRPGEARAPRTRLALRVIEIRRAQKPIAPRRRAELLPCSRKEGATRIERARPSRWARRVIRASALIRPAARSRSPSASYVVRDRRATFGRIVSEGFRL